MMNTTTKVLAVGAMFLGASWTPAWAYEAGPVADGGTIAGQVKFQGAPPPRKPIEITKDKEVCGKDPKMESDLVVGPNGGIQYAVVSLATIQKGKAFDTATTPTLDQKGCEYAPHVVLIPAGGTVDIKNSDGINHNVHAFGKKNPEWNKATPGFFTKQNKALKEKFDQPEYVKMACDVHSWMNGWFVIEDHPYYAVTDDKGMYKLTDVPPGEYELKVWQEKLGEKTQKVTVTAKGEVKADFELAAK